MAQRRMFSDKIVDTDAFLDMGQGSQLLYFHLAMRADDDGFVSNPKKIMRMIGSQDDDYKVLLAKRFIIQFESGVCVIKHWLIHNLIRSDRYTATQWQKEKTMLVIDEKTSKYVLKEPLATKCIPNGNQMATQGRLGKGRLGKGRLGKGRLGDSDCSSLRSPTPQFLTKNFFKDPEPIVNELLANGLPEQTVRQEVAKFCSYWTELNKSGTRQRWEMEKTFEVKKRLGNWFRNIATRSPKFNQQPKGITI